RVAALPCFAFRGLLAGIAAGWGVFAEAAIPSPEVAQVIDARQRKRQHAVMAGRHADQTVVAGGIGKSVDHGIARGRVNRQYVRGEDSRAAEGYLSGNGPGGGRKIGPLIKKGHTRRVVDGEGPLLA